mgnify:CR=1 FL=1
MAATKPIKDVRQIAIVKQYFLGIGHVRDYTLFILCINTALRIGDILRLKWEDVYDFGTRRFRSHIAIRERKTGKENCVALNHNAIEALSRLLAQVEANGGIYIFKSRKGGNRPISRNWAWSIFTSAAQVLSDVEKFSCHSLRKTFGYHAWKSGISSVLLMSIYNHSSFNITKRYLGIDQQEKDLVYGKIVL